MSLTGWLSDKKKSYYGKSEIEDVESRKEEPESAESDDYVKKSGQKAKSKKRRLVSVPVFAAPSSKLKSTLKLLRNRMTLAVVARIWVTIMFIYLVVDLSLILFAQLTGNTAGRLIDVLSIAHLVSSLLLPLYPVMMVLNCVALEKLYKEAAFREKRVEKKQSEENEFGLKCLRVLEYAFYCLCALYCTTLLISASSIFPPFAGDMVSRIPLLVVTCLTAFECSLVLRSSDKFMRAVSRAATGTKERVELTPVATDTPKTPQHDDETSGAVKLFSLRNEHPGSRESEDARDDYGLPQTYCCINSVYKQDCRCSNFSNGFN